MAKINRERAVREKRALKQEKKEARKQAAADAAAGITPDTAEPQLMGPQPAGGEQTVLAQAELRGGPDPSASQGERDESGADQPD
jgi:hypothetical protein